MLQIRHGVFETNSSSTHSITMCTQAEFDAWKNGEVFFDYWKDKFVEDNYDEDCMTYDEYMDDYDLEIFVDSYTTEHGDEIIAFGKYGYC